MAETQEIGGDVASKAQEYPNEGWILAATILVSSMAFIDGSALNVALPVIQTSLNASGAQLLWVINAYLLMLASLILVGGSLGDRLGRRKVFMAGSALFILASLACGISPSIERLIGARVIQGIGGAMMIPGSLAIISASLAPNRRGKGIGTWSAATTLVMVAGPVLGGFLADHGLWRGVFLINLPLGIAALIILATKVPESRDETVKGRLDLGSFLLNVVGLGSLTYGFISAPDLGFSDTRVWGTLTVGIFCLLVFIWWESQVKNPMLPLELFRSRTFSGTNLLTLFLYGALAVMSFFLSLNLIQVQGYSKTQAGLAFLPFVVLLTLLSRWAGGLVDRSGPRLPLILGPTIVGLGFLWTAFTGVTPGPQAYWTTFFPGMTLVGVGMGLVVAPLTTSVMGSVPNHYSGTASGVNNAVSRTAGVLAIAIIGALALILFSNTLQSQASPLHLPPQAQSDLQREAKNLAGAQPPASVGKQNRQAVEKAIKISFTEAFKIVFIVNAVLAFLSALMAFFLVENDYRRSAER
ncbi:MAG TPA: MFS transporter [Anaerolineaceae bacterium]|nr:MFS transporter [Anaerolineaceae bacterium]